MRFAALGEARVRGLVILIEEPELYLSPPAQRHLHRLLRKLSARGRNQVLFHLDGVDLVSRLIDGQFPNYQQVIPGAHTTRAVFDREELLRRLARMVAARVLTR